MPRRPEVLIRTLADRGQLASWLSTLPPRTRLGLVPTMGALHEGHGSLVLRARADCDQVLVSVFVNPLQFDESQDFQAYPRNPEGDLALLDGWGADAAYLPVPSDMYPEDRPTLLQPGPCGRLYEGASRPGHFAGMLTVVNRLFQRIRPERAYFGEKDAQQLFLVREMVAACGMDIEVVSCPTVREADGLALSSRNVHLTPEDRRRAAGLYRALCAARDAAQAGERDPRRLEATMFAVLAEAHLEADYAAVVDERSFLPAPAPAPAPLAWRAVLAVRIGSTRLIDNLSLRAC